MYEVSSLGRIRAIGGSCRKQQQTTDGYLVVSLKYGPEKRRSVHRLVALAFLDTSPDDSYDVDHINCDRRDNRAVNLEWVTPAENNARRDERVRRGTRRGRQIMQIAPDGTVVKVWDSVSEAARSLRLSRSTISGCCNGTPGYQTCGGHGWRFAQDVNGHPDEVWAPAPGMPDAEVSTAGRIKTSRGLHHGSLINGYLYFRNVGIHRLVAGGFPALCPPAQGKTIVNHLDGDKQNNTATNLVWVTQSENATHAHAAGLSTSDVAVLEIRPDGTTDSHLSIAAASRATGCHATSISRAYRGLQNTSGGSQWRPLWLVPSPIPDEDPLWVELGL